MTALTQDNKERGNKMLDRLIDMANTSAVEACEAGNKFLEAGDLERSKEYHAARDGIYMGLAKLIEAKSVLGGVTVPGVSRMGGK